MDAANTGTATRKPACAGESVSCFEMNGASGPNITQVVKPVSKYRKHANRAFQLPLRNELTNCFMTGFLWNGTTKKRRQPYACLNTRTGWRRCLFNDGDATSVPQQRRQL